MNKEKYISYIQLGVLAIICICVFLVVKYIVRSSIIGEEPPIDTSTRL